MQSWIDTINLVAASLSAPVLPAAIGSQFNKFQRPLLPSSLTKCNTREQLAEHQARIQLLTKELEDHENKRPDQEASKRLMHEYLEKKSYYEFEVRSHSLNHHENPIQYSVIDTAQIA